MTRSVFWDTAAFVALTVADDSLHRAAVEVSECLATQGAHLLTTDAVLTEVGDTLSKVRWRAITVEIINAVQESASEGVAEIVHVDPSLWQRAYRLYRERPDKDWSLTDCISFVVMRGRGLQEAFTSDKHFEQAGFRPLIHA